MRYALIAAVVALVAAAAMVAYDCHVGTHEQCLMSQGASWFAGIVVFLLAWGALACFGAAIRSLARPGDEGDNRR